jgi:hypothetical protein
MKNEDPFVTSTMVEFLSEAPFLKLLIFLRKEKSGLKSPEGFFFLAIILKSTNFKTRLVVSCYDVKTRSEREKYVCVCVCVCERGKRERGGEREEIDK